MYTDIHSHILPAVDDGAQTMQQALELLKLSVSENINQIIATPHFYAERHNFEKQTALVHSAFEAVQTEIKNIKLPVVLKQGYEVRYFNGISHCDNIGELCIGGSEFILLELGPEPISDNIINEILELRYCGLKPIMAHIERYAKQKGFKNLKREIISNNILTQVNASSFLSRPFARTVCYMIKEEFVSVIAGDMHSVSLRPPRMAEAYKHIEKRFGQRVKDELVYNANSLFEQI